MSKQEKKKRGCLHNIVLAFAVLVVLSLFAGASPACRNRDVSTKAHLVSGPALIRLPAQRDNAGTFPVDDAVRTADRRLIEKDILTCGHLLNEHSGKFSHKYHPS